MSLAMLDFVSLSEVLASFYSENLTCEISELSKEHISSTHFLWITMEYKEWTSSVLKLASQSSNGTT